uniref:Interferon lambda receptor 1 isoform X1 n=1 Tax=Geotrypetes seraphini TaxID=260995 RepID=A0A6P8S550_GEOSA|nr:interferon lambda receptor 1 isoform X1 [Geotrypetes seraphini]
MVLLLLAFLHQLHARPPGPDHIRQLQPPQNVTLFSRNFRVFLSWVPVDGYPPGVMYTVQSWSQKKWRSACTDITSAECEITCVDKYDLLDKYRARVRASSQGLPSSWKEAKYFDYQEDMELGPPELQVLLHTKTELTIGATVSVPDCQEMRFLNLKYNLGWWKAGTSDRLNYTNNGNVTINKSKYFGNYCMSAGTTYVGVKTFQSTYSEPLCLVLSEKTRWEVPVIMGVMLVSLLTLLTTLVSLYFYAFKAGGIRSPKALDFAKITTVPHKQPEEHEGSVLKEYLVCTVDQCTFLAPSLLEGEDSEEDEGTYGEYTEKHQVLPVEECIKSETDSQGLLSSASDSGYFQDLKELGFLHFGLGDRDQEGPSIFQESRALRDPSSCQSIEEPLNFGDSSQPNRSPDWSQLPTRFHDFITSPAARCFPAGDGSEAQSPPCLGRAALLARQTDDVLPGVCKGICFQTLQLAEDSGQTGCSTCGTDAEMVKDTAELTQPITLGGNTEEDTRAEDINVDLKTEVQQNGVCQSHYMSRNG